MPKVKSKVTIAGGEGVPIELSPDYFAVDTSGNIKTTATGGGATGDLDGGAPDTNYGGVDPIDGGTP